MYGISYPGFYVSAGMIDAHPALAAVSPQAPVRDWFIGDDFHHNGAFYQVHALRWFSANSRTMQNPAKGPTTPQAVDYNTPRWLQVLPRHGAIGELRRERVEGFGAVLDRHGASRNLRRILESAQHPPAYKNLGRIVFDRRETDLKSDIL